MKKDDVDWAENYTMEEARSVQSEYWSQKQTSLFICISKVLLLSHWSATTGELKAGSEVTVELGSGDKFWAVVLSGSGDSEDAIYTVQGEDGNSAQVPRKQLRARVWFTAALVGVTGVATPEPTAAFLYCCGHQGTGSTIHMPQSTSCHCSSSGGLTISGNQSTAYTSTLITQGSISSPTKP